jgi:hypothetical protein
MRKSLIRAANKLLSVYKLELGQAELQQWIESRFPIRKEGIVTLTLKDPIVRLEPHDDRLGIELTVRGEVAKGLALEGRWMLEGAPAFDRGKGELYLRNPIVRGINSGLRIRSSNGSSSKGLMEEMLAGALSEVPIYKLEQGRLGHALARLCLKSIEVRGDRLLVEFGLETANPPAR